MEWSRFSTSQRSSMARRLTRLPLRLTSLVAAPKPLHHHRRLPIPTANPSPTSPASLPFPRLPPPSIPSSISRHFCSASSAGDSSSMVVVGSAESFASIHSKVQDEKLPAVFYYTAVWCGPCRAMAPVIAKLSSQYPKIPVYKVDIDMDGIGSKLSTLNICSVPTFHFYLKGQKTSEIVGADVRKLEIAMESLDRAQ